MSEQPVHVKLTKCLLVLYPSEIRKCLTPELMEIGLARGKSYKRAQR